MASFRKTFVPVVVGAVFILGLTVAASAPNPDPPGYAFIDNQYEHTAVLVDLSSKQPVARVEVGVNGHEVVVDAAHHFGYVPIYGNSGVGKPGTDGDRVDIIDLKDRKLAGSIPLGKPVRPHCARFGPDGDRKSTRLNSSHSQISYAVFCLKKKQPHSSVVRHSPSVQCTQRH